MIRLGRISRAILVLGVVLLCTAHYGAWAADGVVLIDKATQQVDVSSARNPLVAAQPEIGVQGPQETAKTILKAVGAGPNFYWSLFSFQNTSTDGLDFVLQLEPQRFAGSGILAVRPWRDGVLGATLTHPPQPAQLVPSQNGQLLAFHAGPNETINIAVETADVDLKARLWQAAALRAADMRATYFGGVFEGCALLLIVGMLMLQAFRPNRANFAGLAVMLALTYLMELDTGLLRARVAFADSLATSLQALGESLLLGAVALCAWSFAPQGKARPVVYAILPVLAALAIAIGFYGFAEPLRASAIARAALPLVAVLGLGLSIWSKFRGKDQVDSSLIFGIGLLVWVLLAGVVAKNVAPEILHEIQLAAAALALMVVLFAVVLRFVFKQGLMALPFINETNLRSLALSSGRHVFWDWQPDSDKLEIGKELARVLDLPEENWAEKQPELFHRLLHPLDLPAYEKLAERRDFKPGERVQLEFRLRHANGSYRWHELSARFATVPGERQNRCLGTLTDISRLKQVEERLASDPLHDVVTGLPSKALLMDRLARGMAQAGGLPMRVITIDIDRFKILNEGLGQDIGDKILKAIAERLRSLIEGDETVARQSGGQFLMLAHESTRPGDIATFGMALLSKISEPIKHGPQQIVVTASIGISHSAHDVADAQVLIEQSQLGMLEAREEGGAKSVVYHTEMKDDRSKLLSLEADLRQALARNEINIFYQPIVYLGNLDVVGFEALARWQHPQLGLLSPADFMDVAETAGMMIDIGQFIFASAARQLGIWQRIQMRGRSFFVSVNASATQISDPEFQRRVRQILDRESLDAGSLKIEITESVIMRQPERAASLLLRLQAMGVGLACDDFGTGFSSLASLRDFPFDTLKIDRSFILPGSLEGRNEKIISSITSLAQSLGMAVVAEGIETQDQIDRLAALGVGFGQGYLLGVPMPADRASALLSSLPVGGAGSQVRSPTQFLPPLEPSKSLYAPLSDEDVAAPFVPPPSGGVFVIEELPSIFGVGDAKPKPKSKVKKRSTRKKQR